MDSATKQKLETILTNFEQMTGTQIAAVIVQSLNDRPIEEYSNALYRAWGIGAKSGENKNKGALLIVSLQDRKTRLEVGYGLEGDLPDGLAGELIRRMRPYLQQQQYSEAMTVGVRSITDTLAEKWQISLAGIEDRRYAYRPGQGKEGSGKGVGVLFLVFIGFIILMGIISRSSRGRGGGGGSSSLWWLAPLIFNRGGGSFGGGSSDSGGGWGGGGDSGGSDWGGFGGGDSGGGGASDSW
ncbi:MAG: TPM domain-containing protein [Acidobacteriota bacterium]|nr:TPM domain-containing protein [Acidobacteriota bacterium]